MYLTNPKFAKDIVVGVIRETSQTLPKVGKKSEVLRSVKSGKLTSALDGLAATNSYLVKGQLPDCKKLPFVFVNRTQAKNTEELCDFFEQQRAIVSKLTLEQKMISERGGIRKPINYDAYPIKGDYTVDRYVHSRKGYTSGLDDCIGVLLYNGNDAYLYHLSPNLHQFDSAIDYLKKTLSSRIIELSGQTKCRACLVGGQDKYSRPFYKHIKNVLKQHDIKTQEILFADGGHSDIYYDLDKGIFPQFLSGCNLEKIKKYYAQVQL